VGEVERQLALRHRLADPPQQKVDDLLDLVLRQLVEDDDLVDAVEELGPEDLLQLAHDPRLHVVVGDTGLVADREADRRVLGDVRRTDVRGHDHDRVTEVDGAAPTGTAASGRGSGVGPTPGGAGAVDGPVARLGAFRPARARRIAFETASLAACWPLTRLWSSSSMRISFWVSASVSLNTGMPVHIETMSAISSSPISGRSPDSPERHCSSIWRFLFVSWRSWSRRFAAFSNSCASIAASFSRRVFSMSSSSSR